MQVAPPGEENERLSATTLRYRYENAVVNTDYKFKVVAVYGPTGSEITAESDIVTINHAGEYHNHTTVAFARSKPFYVSLFNDSILGIDLTQIYPQKRKFMPKTGKRNRLFLIYFVARAPSKPVLSWEEAENFNVVLAWTAPADYGAPITKYKIIQVFCVVSCCKL